MGNSVKKDKIYSYDQKEDKEVWYCRSCRSVGYLQDIKIVREMIFSFNRVEHVRNCYRIYYNVKFDKEEQFGKLFISNSETFYCLIVNNVTKDTIICNERYEVLFLLVIDYDSPPSKLFASYDGSALNIKSSRELKNFEKIILDLQYKPGEFKSQEAERKFKESVDKYNLVPNYRI